MKRTRHLLGATVALTVASMAGLVPAGLAQAITLDLPDTAKPSAQKSESLASYALPIGPFSDRALPTRRVEGALTQVAWRVESPGATTLELLSPLRGQLMAIGFKPVFDCDTAECGGFDFRYATSVLPEPEMHVDLGDFRFFAAERGEEVVSLMVSRTAAAGFVQMTHVGGTSAPAPVLTASTKASPAKAVALSTGQAPSALSPKPDSIGAKLMSGGSLALDDLVFASGTSTLAEGDYKSLQELAAWLGENPGLTIALVGHTDASGGLEGNIALSRKRAMAVRNELITRHNIPQAQVEAQGVGYLSPRASNLTAEGRDKNRRVEVMVTSTLQKP